MRDPGISDHVPRKARHVIISVISTICRTDASSRATDPEQRAPRTMVTSTRGGIAVSSATVSDAWRDGKHARDMAARYGMTITAYFTALVRGETPAPMPAAFAQLGNCVSGAIAVLDCDPPDTDEAKRLLTAARAHGAQLGREWLLPTYRARIAELPEDNWEIPG
jgi:hypothetical protein